MEKEEVKNIIIQFPLFIPEITHVLERRDWLVFDEYLENILFFLNEENELDNFPFLELINKEDVYFPVEISKEEWEKFGISIITKQLINFLNGNQLLNILTNLKYKEFCLVFNRILELIPEKNYEEKLLWLEENKPSFYNIFLTLPFNPFINNLIKDKYLKINENELEKIFNNIDEELKYQLLNYNNAEQNLAFATENLFSQEKTLKLTYLTGQILLGFIKPNFIENEINKIFDFQENKELTENIKNYLLQKYFLPNEEKIKNLFIITSDILAKPKIKEEKEIEIPISKSEEEIKTFQKLDLTELIEKKDEIKEEKPLIINEEKPLQEIKLFKKENKDLEKEKQIKKIFSPFKIFNKFTSQNKPEIIAKIEKPEKIVNYSENKTSLETENNKELEEIFLKPNINLENLPEERKNENIIDLKNINE
ncbi:MAG: hypothetical protein QXO12_03105 [Candidatus Pacearchaeota archaeon]